MTVAWRHFTRKIRGTKYKEQPARGAKSVAFRLRRHVGRRRQYHCWLLVVSQELSAHLGRRLGSIIGFGIGSALKKRTPSPALPVHHFFFFFFAKLGEQVARKPLVRVKLGVRRVPDPFVDPHQAACKTNIIFSGVTISPAAEVICQNKMVVSIGDSRQARAKSPCSWIVLFVVE